MNITEKNKRIQILQNRNIRLTHQNQQLKDAAHKWEINQRYLPVPKPI